MGRQEERNQKRSQKKQFKKQGMSEKNYNEFMDKVNEKYYRDIVIMAFNDVYNVFCNELTLSMKNNRISSERADKIIREALDNTRAKTFDFKGEV